MRGQAGKVRWWVGKRKKSAEAAARKTRNDKGTLPLGSRDGVRREKKNKKKNKKRRECRTDRGLGEVEMRPW